MEELSPGVRSLQIRYDGRRIPQDQLLRHLIDLEQHLPDASSLKIPTRVVHLPMAFEDSATLGAVQRYSETVRKSAPWLPNNVDFIQRINGLASRDASSRHRLRRALHGARPGRRSSRRTVRSAGRSPTSIANVQIQSRTNLHRRGTVGIGGVYIVHLWHGFAGRLSAGRADLADLEQIPQERHVRARQAVAATVLRSSAVPSGGEAELNELREAFREGRADIRIEQESIRLLAEHQRFLLNNVASIAEFRARQKTAFDIEVTRWQTEDAPVLATSIAVDSDLDDDLDGHTVTADMCGSVWKILVSPDQTVAAGQPLIIVEAMKMELTVASPIAGRVKGIRCAVGEGGQYRRCVGGAGGMESKARTASRMARATSTSSLRRSRDRETLHNL